MIKCKVLIEINNIHTKGLSLNHLAKNCTEPATVQGRPGQVDKWIGIGVLSHQEPNFDVKIVKIPKGEGDKDMEPGENRICILAAVCNQS